MWTNLKNRLNASRSTHDATEGSCQFGKPCGLRGRSWHAGRRRKGAAVVEFAFVAPVFFLLVFGMIEYGRMVMVQQVITNASREGARQAVLDGATSGSVTTAVTTYLSNSSVSGASVTVSPNPPSSAGYGGAVTVTVSIPFSQVSWLPTPMFLGGKTLTASTVMRREAVQ